MKIQKLAIVILMGAAVAVAGCAKKSAEQANLSGTGFDSVSSNDELAQLPQANNTTNQQGAVEVLPIETSPVTQAAAIAPIPSQALGQAVETARQTATSALNKSQQIQTALKNAGLYQGAIDGKIGPRTKKAIEAFQSQNGLKADGKVGPKTWAAMEKYLTEQTAVQRETSAAPAVEN